ncbi:MAG: hypothetical protein HQL84_09015 [Magnetococcales bacterium]|nr:hypothetical protein [Magnetococcales bacterium]MBF0630500.1 hypothetical protein [Magnetococcales bacterium]
MIGSGIVQGLTPERTAKLEKLKNELEELNRAVQSIGGGNQFETEGLVRAFHDKEVEIKSFLRNEDVNKETRQGDVNRVRTVAEIDQANFRRMEEEFRLAGWIHTSWSSISAPDDSERS